MEKDDINYLKSVKVKPYEELQGLTEVYFEDFSEIDCNFFLENILGESKIKERFGYFGNWV